jgi:hypothetical protein
VAWKCSVRRRLAARGTCGRVGASACGKAQRNRPRPRFEARTFGLQPTELPQNPFEALMLACIELADLLRAGPSTHSTRSTLAQGRPFTLTRPICVNLFALHSPASAGRRRVNLRFVCLRVYSRSLFVFIRGYFCVPCSLLSILSFIVRRLPDDGGSLARRRVDSRFLFACIRASYSCPFAVVIRVHSRSRLQSRSFRYTSMIVVVTA